MNANRAAGFTLVELVAGITLLGLLAGVAAVIVLGPVQAYFAGQRRAALADVADTALRRAGRDVRLALPNSVRVGTSGVNTFLELLLTRTGGRYRSQLGAGTENVLDFAAADTLFDTLEPMSTLPGQTIAVNSDRVVVHNLGISGASAYDGDNISLITGFTSPSGAAANEDRIQVSSKLFPLESPGRRFSVVAGPVTFECRPNATLDANGDGQGQLRRVSGYGIRSAGPDGTYSGSPVTAVLANYVTSCAIDYSILALQARGLVAFRLGLTRGNETVNIYYEAHVSNVP